ncbi:MAG: Undecaprenyl diphosphate synthase, partial [uncultured Acetobacteraceae bacterium]
DPRRAIIPRVPGLLPRAARRPAGRRAPPRRHHHGRQPPLGAGPRPARRARPQGRGGRRAPRHGSGRRAGRGLAHPVRLLVGELAPPSGGGDGLDGPAAFLSPFGGRVPGARGRAAPRHRRPRPLRSGHHAGDGARRGGHRERHPPQSHRRHVLRRAGGDPRRGARHRGGLGLGHVRSGGAGRGRLRRAPRHRGDARPRPHHPHLRRATLVQFPPVASGLRGVRLPGRAVARLRRPAPRGRHPGIRAARAALRRACRL